MRKVILQEWVTIDGFAADQNGETSFFDSWGGDNNIDKEVDKDLLRSMDNVDTILLGATTYRMFKDYWPTATTDTEIVADKMNTTPKIVFSKTLDKAPWGTWNEATVIKADAVEKVAKLKQQKSGKDIAVHGSITLAQSLMKEGLVDEYQLRVCPVVIGNGRQLFPDDTKLDMELLQTKKYSSGLVYLHYQSIGK